MAHIFGRAVFLLLGLMAFLALTDSSLASLSTSKAQEEIYDSSFRLSGSFGIRLSSTGRKVFFFIYSLHGKRKRLTLGTYPALSLTEARKQALEYVRCVAAGRDPQGELRSYSRGASFADLTELFLTQTVDGRCAKNTAREYRRIIQKELLPAWRNLKVVDIRPADILRLLELITAGRGKPVMAARVQALIHRIFAFAVERALLDRSPASGLLTDEKPPAHRRMLTSGEIKDLWAALEAERPFIRGVFKVLLLTGQRPKDVLTMRWPDIKLDCWNVTRSAAAEDLALAQGSKHSSQRRTSRAGSFSRSFRPGVYLSPLAIQVLSEVRDEKHRADAVAKELAPAGRQRPSDEYVFSSSRAPHLVYIRKAASRISRRMGLVPAWSPADLRRTVSAQLRLLGVKQPIIDIVLGRPTGAKKGLFASEEEAFLQAKKALLLWSRQLAIWTRGSPDQPSSKVVKLFR